jgi:O-6-methylguanine DNA methyltransferase
MQCKSVLFRLDGVRTGEVDPHEVHEIEKHLGSCRTCDETATAIAELAESLRAASPALRDANRSEARCSCFDFFDEVHVGGEALHVAFTDKGVSMVERRLKSDEAFSDLYFTRFGRALKRANLPAAWRDEIAAALGGEPPKKPDVDVSGLGDFERNVLMTLTKIPRGEVRTYSWLAREAGCERAVRAVGTALRRNPVAPLLPCHRVVPSSGGTGKYALGSEAKVHLLRLEGVDVDTLSQFAARGVRFVGSKTTGIYCFPTCRDARRIRDENRVLLRDERDAREKGFRPCMHCRPVVTA